MGLVPSTPLGRHPCRCLCFGLSQITRTTPLRRTILHFEHILFTEARTFIVHSSIRFVRTFLIGHSAVDCRSAPVAAPSRL
jgi:hypothetical protein